MKKIYKYHLKKILDIYSNIEDEFIKEVESDYIFGHRGLGYDVIDNIDKERCPSKNVHGWYVGHKYLIRVE